MAILAPAHPELAFKLYLEIAMSTDLLARHAAVNYQNSSAEFSSIAYDFLTQAFLVYEDEISESAAQVSALTSIVGVLLEFRTFEKAEYEALITKTAQYAAKLLKKPDQCRMVCLCSRLFYVVRKDDVSFFFAREDSVCCGDCPAISFYHVAFPCLFSFFINSFPPSYPRIPTPTATHNAS